MQALLRRFYLHAHQFANHHNKTMDTRDIGIFSISHV